METSNSLNKSKNKNSEFLNNHCNKPIKLIVSVKDVVYKTNQKGIVNPILLLNETKELNQINIDAVIYRTRSFLEEKGIGKGSRIKIQFQDGKDPEILNVIREGKLPPINESCDACGEKLITDSAKDQICNNRYCPANSMGFVNKLLDLATEGSEILPITIHTYLNEYAIYEEKNSIDSIAEFRFLMNQLKDRRTQARLKTWQRIHGENYGEVLWKLDCAVWDYLNKDTLPTNNFWSICNFPKITPSDFLSLCTIDPSKLIEGDIRDEYLALTKEARKRIDHNLDFVMWLHEMFNEFGEKKWIVV